MLQINSPGLWISNKNEQFFSYLFSILNKNMFRMGIVLFPKADAAEDVMVATLAE